MLTCIPPVISYLHNDVLGIAQHETKIKEHLGLQEIYVA